MYANGFVEFVAQYGIWLFGANLGLAFIGAAMAKKRGYSYGGFLCLGIFTSFLINLIVAACLKPKPTSEYFYPKNRYKEKTISCTGCGAVCTQDMAFCPECGKPLKNKCKQCGAQCLSGMTFCPQCGANIAEW